MSRINLVKLRKRAGMSQKELAELLQVRPSFLSAIENGKSRMPEEKLDKLMEIFELDSLDDYMEDDNTDIVIPPHTHTTDQTDTITLLLNQFHDLAHQRDKSHSHSSDTAERMEFLMKRNDRLSERIDDLRDEVDKLRKENLALKEQLLRNGITPM